MDVKKNFMQAFKELTGSEEEEAAKAAEKQAAAGKPVVAPEEKPAFSSAFDNIKAQYAATSSGTATPTTTPTPPVAPAAPAVNNTPKKPAFTPPASPVTDKKPAFTPSPAKPAFTPPATPVRMPEQKPVEAKPIEVPSPPQKMEAPIDSDEFANTFLKSRGIETTISEEKTKDVKNSMERAIFHPDSPSEQQTEVTVITVGTSVIGTITTSNSIVVDGKIEGDVDTTHNATVTGKVEGVIKCKTADLFDCEIVGDIVATDHVRISENTKVDGNISTDSIEVDGKIKGNIVARGSINIMRNALVIGDITASKLSIEEGAMLQGNVSMKIN